jgi:hypothetical protein
MIEPVKIELEALYDDSALRQAAGLSQSALARARREGRLRYTRRGGRILYTGRWLMDWLTSPEADGPAVGPAAIGQGVADVVPCMTGTAV